MNKIIFIFLVIFLYFIHHKIKKEYFSNKLIDFSKIKKENDKYNNNIILYVKGGLGNKLNFINYFYPIANRLKRKVFIYWFKYSGINIDFDELFTQPKLNFINIKKINNYHTLNKYYINKNSNNNKNHKPLKDINKDKNKTIVVEDWGIWDMDEKNDYFYKALQIYPSIYEKIDNIFFNKKIIGVHIRCGDLNKCDNFYLKKITYLIDKLIKQNTGYKVFIMTDDEDLKNKYKIKYDAFTYNIKLSKSKNISPIRNTKEGITDSVLELYSLSLCYILIGSKSTSFFHAAKQISKSKQIYYF